MTKNVTPSGRASARAGQKARKKPEAPEPLRVQRIAVRGLFGLYDHEIELHLDDRVTILHGPNGVGKTVLLSFIAGLFTGHHTDFERYPFNSFSVEFTSGSSLTIEFTKKNGKQRKEEAQLKISHCGSSSEILQTVEIPIGSSEIEAWVGRFFMNESYIMPFDPGLWLDQPTGKVLTTREVFDRYASKLGRPLFSPIANSEPSWLTELRHRIPVHVIEAQRLLRPSQEKSPSEMESQSAYLPAVRGCASDLGVKIKNALAQYGSQSQALDQSFPQRLLKAASMPRMPRGDLKRKMAELNKQRIDLQDIGLLDSTPETPFDVARLDDLAPEQSAVMSLYADDTQHKLSVLEDLARRIRLLLVNVNSKFKHKSIRIDREKGFVALGHDGSQLDPSSLSSGEQHELVLLYDLLFRVQPGTLVLIDEPELSLHVSWQKQFLPDLLEIVKIAKLDVIIATHSPFIVGDRSDLMVPLAAEIDA